MRFSASLLFALLLALSCLITGCATLGSPGVATDNKLVIPDFPTVEQQYKFALSYQAGQVVSPDAAKRKGQMIKAIQCYEKVLTNFPEDTSFCPRAILEIGDCWVQSGEMGKAVQQYSLARDRYPNDVFIQARSRFATARSLDMQHKYAEAKAIYKEIMDNYGESTSGQVRDVVSRASKLYYQVKESPKPKKKKKSGN